MEELPKLFNKTSLGQIQVWSITVDGNKFYTTEGILDGKMTTSLPTICAGKNAGKANETSGEDQALKEAKSKWKKKLDSGYHEDIANVDESKFTEPMLAKNYDDEFDGNFPVYSDRKYDGSRFVVDIKTAKSRNGKEVLSVPHIRKALEPLFKADPTAILDGELYSHDLHDDFNKIMSLVRKSKPTEEDLKESAAIVQYHVYDFISQGHLKFSERKAKLEKLLKLCDPKIIVTVKSDIAHSQEELDKLYEQYMSSGYEGQMIRLDKPYEHKRSKHLLKRKTFIDSEYIIVDVCEGEGQRTGTVGYMVLRHPDGRTFKSNVKGTFAYLRQLLLERSVLIGKQATCKYFQLTPDGIPRFPYVIAIRDYE